jgi:beta-glucanase (GH16 family)
MIGFAAISFGAGPLGGISSISMGKVLALILFPFLSILATSCGEPAGTILQPPQSSNVIFFDNFAGTTLDTTKWVAMDRAGDFSNNEQECYKPSQVRVSNSMAITSIPQSASCSDATHALTQFPVVSGMVQLKTFNFTYGTVEFKARMAGGQGTWPAVWMLGVNCQQSNITTADNIGTCNWPQAGSDEIDIAEIKNSDQKTVWQNVISGSIGFQTCKPTTTDVSQNFHVYQLLWAPGSLEWKIDGISTCKFTTGIPSNPMFVIINTAMGGAGGSIDSATLPQTTTVDYVKITQP